MGGIWREVEGCCAFFCSAAAAAAAAAAAVGVLGEVDELADASTAPSDGMGDVRGGAERGGPAKKMFDYGRYGSYSTPTVDVKCGASRCSLLQFSMYRTVTVDSIGKREWDGIGYGIDWVGIVYGRVDDRYGRGLDERLQLIRIGWIYGNLLLHCLEKR